MRLRQSDAMRVTIFRGVGFLNEVFEESIHA